MKVPIIVFFLAALSVASLSSDAFAEKKLVSGTSYDAFGSFWGAQRADLQIVYGKNGKIKVTILAGRAGVCIPRFGMGTLVSHSGGSIIPQRYQTATLPIIEGCGGNRKAGKAVLWINLESDGRFGRIKLVEDSKSRSKHTFWTNF